MRNRPLVWMLVALALLGGCEDRPLTQDRAARFDAPAPADAVVVSLVYGSEKRTWLDGAIQRFEASRPKTAGNKPIVVRALAEGSGESVSAILAGVRMPVAFSPASTLYLDELDARWRERHGAGIASGAEPLALSPVVLATWRPMAEALGWPAKPIGWADVVKLGGAPGGWASVGHAEWGRFKLGHTHPDFSSSGLQALVAEGYAGAGKTRDLAPADIASAPVRALLASVEGTIVHYGKSTGFFAEKMVARGPSYLSAAVLYENLVVESYASGPGPHPPLVAIYPSEGTFWADHPFAVLDAPWVSAAQREGAKKLFAFLRSRPEQQRAAALGFRPADRTLAVGAPIDAAHGVDPTEPKTLLEIPKEPTMRALRAEFDRAKKPSDVVLCFDKSGSMEGEPLAQAKRGADAFIDALGARDEVAVTLFDGRVAPMFGPMSLGESRPRVKAYVGGAIASGNTALYDAVAGAFERASAAARAAPEKIHAVVVMTDGRDTDSRIPLDDLLRQLAADPESSARVFTLAYGDGADPAVLTRIAESGRGSSVKGDARTIVEVYKDLAAFF